MPFQSGLEHILREGELLAPYTWLRLGGEAQYFAEPTTVEELTVLVQRCRDEDVPVRLLGGGSNLLVRDDGVEGLVLHLTAAPFCAVSACDGIITAGGGAKLTHLISTAVREGLEGLEQLIGIPGTVGGALHGNANCHGDNIGQCTFAATVMSHTGEIINRSREDLVFAYRESSLDELVILSAQFQMEPADPKELTKRMQHQWILNKAAQPLRSDNTTMLFKDPGGVSAASLIEQAGLKGCQAGGAALSDRNANFVTTEKDASSKDVLELVEHIKNTVFERLGVELETAVEIW